MKKYVFDKEFSKKYMPDQNYRFVLLKNTKNNKAFYDTQVNILTDTFENALEYSELYSIMNRGVYEFAICDYDVWLLIIRLYLVKSIVPKFSIGFDLDSDNLNMEVYYEKGDKPYSKTE